MVGSCLLRRIVLKSNCDTPIDVWLVSGHHQARQPEQEQEMNAPPHAAMQAAQMKEESEPMAGTVTSLCNSCLVTKIIVLTPNCPYSAGPLQSECSDWIPLAASFHQECPYIRCPYKEKSLHILRLLQPNNLLKKPLSLVQAAHVEGRCFVLNMQSCSRM